MADQDPFGDVLLDCGMSKNRIAHALSHQALGQTDAVDIEYDIQLKAILRRHLFDQAPIAVGQSWDDQRKIRQAHD